LSTSGGQCLFPELVLEIGLSIGAYHDRLEFFVVFDTGDPVGRLQHVLIEQIPDREIIRVIADRHHRDDLASVEKQGHRALHHDGGLHGRALVVDAGDDAR
jgi:hypothetical protein